jgi:hypothetical protein
MKQSKTDPFGHGVDIYIGRTGIYWLVSSGSDSSLHGNSATTGRSLIHSYRQVTHEKLALAVHRNIAYDTPAIVSEWDIWQRPKQAWKTSW